MSRIMSFLANFSEDNHVKIYKNDQMLFSGEVKNATNELEKDYNIVSESVKPDGQFLVIKVK